MSSEYLKQLQLTKQLEQKAKEAARNRKLAEDKLAEAAQGIDLSRRMGVEVVALELELSAGRTAFGKRDFVAARDSAERTIGEARKLLVGKVEEVLSSAHGVAAMIDDQGEDHQAIETLVERSRQKLVEGRIEEAMSAAVESRKAAEQYADRRMSEMFVQLGNLIALGEKEKIAVAARKQALNKAIKLHEEGDREGSLTKAVSCFKGLQEAFTKIADARAGSIMELVEGGSPGADMSAITALVDTGREQMGRGKIEESLRTLGQAQEALRPILVEAVKALIAAQEERNAWPGARSERGKGSPRPIRKVSEANAGGDSEEALELLRRTEKSLRESEMGVVLEHIEDLRPRMVLAKRASLDLERVMSRLEEARTATIYGRAREAIEMIDDASAELDDALAPFRRVERELNETRAPPGQAHAHRLRGAPGPAPQDALRGGWGTAAIPGRRGVLVRIVRSVRPKVSTASYGLRGSPSGGGGTGGSWMAGRASGRHADSNSSRWDVTGLGGVIAGPGRVRRPPALDSVLRGPIWPRRWICGGGPRSCWRRRTGTAPIPSPGE